jgi:hypothetical protein
MEPQGRTILEIARGQTSEGQLFDELSQGIASGAISRRRTLKLAGAAILGSIGLLALFPGVAGARSDRKCRGKPALNNTRCGGRIVCRGRNQNCVCAEEAMGGDKRCVQLRSIPCPRRDECDRNRDCRSNEVCIKVGGCCGHPRRNLCVDLCA